MRREELRKAVEEYFRFAKGYYRALENKTDCYDQSTTNGYAIKIRTKKGMNYTYAKNSFDNVVIDHVGVLLNTCEKKLTREEMIRELYLTDRLEDKISECPEKNIPDFVVSIISYDIESVNGELIFLSEELRKIPSSDIDDIYVKPIYNEEWDRDKLFRTTQNQIEELSNIIQNIVNNTIEEKEEKLKEDILNMGTPKCVR